LTGRRWVKDDVTNVVGRILAGEASLVV